MEYDEVAALFDYWKTNPPSHVMIQGFFKMGGGDTKSGEMTDEQFQELSAAIPMR
jgi:hypothetical protein